MTGKKRSNKYSPNKFSMKVVSGVLVRGELNLSTSHCLKVMPATAIRQCWLGLALHSAASAWACPPRSWQNVNVLSYHHWHRKMTKSAEQATDDRLLMHFATKCSQTRQRTHTLHSWYLLPSFSQMHPPAPETQRAHTIIKICQFICFMPLLSNLSQTSVDPTQVSQIISIHF